MSFKKSPQRIKKRTKPKKNIVFLSGEANPLKLDASERRFMVSINPAIVQRSDMEFAA